MIWVIVLSGLINFFCVDELLFFCSPKRKEAKEKGASRGRLLVNGSKVKITRSVELRWTPLSCGVCSAAVIHDGLLFVSMIINNYSV